MCLWARETLLGMEPPEAAATVRVRLDPSPDRGAALVLTPLEGERSLDQALELLEARLAELPELPSPCKLRVELLDGTGEQIRGCCKARTWRFEPMAQQQSAETVSTPTTTPARHGTAANAQPRPNRRFSQHPVRTTMSVTIHPSWAYRRSRIHTARSSSGMSSGASHGPSPFHRA